MGEGGTDMLRPAPMGPYSSGRVVFGGLAIALLTGMVPLSLVVAVAVGALLLILWQANRKG